MHKIRPLPEGSTFTDRETGEASPALALKWVDGYALAVKVQGRGWVPIDQGALS